LLFVLGTSPVKFLWNIGCRQSLLDLIARTPISLEC